MIRYLYSIVLLGLFLGAQAFAHDLRVAQLGIEELDTHEYVLRYEVPMGEQNIYGLPQLPEHCEWHALPDVIEGSLQLRFTAKGRPLAAGDVILLPWERNGVQVSIVWKNGTNVRQFFPPSKGGIRVELDQLQAGSGSFLRTAKRYIGLGVHHILIGTDHIFFVFGLLLLVSSPRKLLWTVTSFTLAHSITLGLSIFEILRFPSSVVETLIALSIVLLAKEILMAQRGEHGLAWKYPWAIAFIFGLVHGLGFAGALREIGLPNESIPQVLLFFNIGVELGQFAFVLVCWAIIFVIQRLGINWSKAWYRIPPYVLGSTATVWLFTRLPSLFE
ncbi:HupE/UreJ family protein [Coraliomargarita sp. SDUM461003]|uniref:HupE/UreJ family protein n=1 Tax=Thalassobacterium maritimum TaxID=3041265 RepID=A0ABU1ATD7_9BACT|nr:HupE/UreJ family protein [Coraliomargarita sp. SDUM461003]MDQ8207420.1 HupE/UreJ family protein [Coraliomargarita sp. SDUM461003]